MKTIVMTGCSTGLGRASAILFAKKGWKVYATMRNPNDAGELSEYQNVSIKKLDVTNSTEIKEVVASILEETTVDVVFNNAGYGLAGPFEGMEDEQLTRQFETNVLGTMRVTKEFLPALRLQGHGLIMVTTSIGGLLTFPLNSVYHATKWALEGWAESLQFEIEPHGLQIKTIAPGGILTDFAGRSLDRAGHEAYNETISKVFARFSNPERRAMYSTAESIAETVYEAATDGLHQLRYVAGNDARYLYTQRIEMGVDASREAIREAFLG
jgi:NAD(P)-dependent dehydrogenase (short-subunit alcohol dehydrogenase family)